MYRPSRRRPNFLKPYRCVPLYSAVYGVSAPIATLVKHAGLPTITLSAAAIIDDCRKTFSASEEGQLSSIAIR